MLDLKRKLSLTLLVNLLSLLLRIALLMFFKLLSEAINAYAFLALVPKKERRVSDRVVRVLFSLALSANALHSVLQTR